MIIVQVMVHEPANPAANTIEEDVITGIYHGFKDEEDAMNWCSRVQRMWGGVKKMKEKGVKFHITTAEPFSDLCL